MGHAPCRAVDVRFGLHGPCRSGGHYGPIGAARHFPAFPPLAADNGVVEPLTPSCPVNPDIRACSHIPVALQSPRRIQTLMEGSLGCIGFVFGLSSP